MCKSATYIDFVLPHQLIKVGILDIDETTGKETVEGFSSEFGSGSCAFFKCDVTETEQLKGGNV